MKRLFVIAVLFILNTKAVFPQLNEKLLVLNTSEVKATSKALNTPSHKTLKFLTDKSKEFFRNIDDVSVVLISPSGEFQYRKKSGYTLWFSHKEPKDYMLMLSFVNTTEDEDSDKKQFDLFKNEVAANYQHFDWGLDSRNLGSFSMDPCAAYRTEGYAFKLNHSGQGLPARLDRGCRTEILSNIGESLKLQNSWVEMIAKQVPGNPISIVEPLGDLARSIGHLSDFKPTAKGSNIWYTVDPFGLTYFIRYKGDMEVLNGSIVGDLTTMIEQNKVEIYLGDYTKKRLFKIK